jgi:flagellar basal body P-ring formation protein FlgA
MRQLFTRSFRLFGLCLAASLAAPDFAFAAGSYAGGNGGGETRSLPVPSITIYPGDRIKDEWLVEREFSPNMIPLRVIADNRNELIGKIARRTLFPGTPIAVTAVTEPNLVTNGAKVKIVYNEGGLTITAFGNALQAGSAGDVVSVRNTDSGLTISGIVQQDGSVLINGG